MNNPRYIECFNVPIRNDEHIKLLDCYAQPWRFYHTTQHLAEMAKHYGVVEKLVSWRKPKEVAAAIMFHDAVYVPGHPRNEEMSCAMMQKSLSNRAATGVPMPDLEVVAGLIIATEVHFCEDSPDQDLRHFLDMDIATFGSEPERYAEVSKQLEQELGHLQPYKWRRIDFLRGVLDRDHIYHTEVFRTLFEQKARANIRGEIAELEA